MSTTYVADGAGSLGGPIGNTRSTGLSVLWAILTLGIYTYVWTYRQFEEFKQYSGKGIGGGLGVVIAIFTGIVLWFVGRAVAPKPDNFTLRKERWTRVGFRD